MLVFKQKLHLELHCHWRCTCKRLNKLELGLQALRGGCQSHAGLQIGTIGHDVDGFCSQELASASS
jgi:hypothetical protein